MGSVTKNRSVKAVPRKAQAGSADWREETLAHVRLLILKAVSGVTEERKWKKASNAMAGVPVWSSNGIVCTGETYKEVVKLTFAKGASLPDPARLFNSSLEGNTRRAIDIREGDRIDAKWGSAFKALVKAAAKFNAPAEPKVAKNTKPVKLLSGGNPQIAKGDGDAPVRAYIEAMSGGGPGWKRDLGRRLDALIVRSVPTPPGVRKAVKWNSPFYGVDAVGDRSWFLGIHCFTKYVKLAFFRGTSLRPLPPEGTAKSGETRYLNIHENDKVDEAQLASWVKQAAALPGWTP